MSFKLPNSYYEKQNEEYNQKYVFIDDKKIHVSELKDRTVTTEMKNRMSMNTYAKDELPPKLTDETLIQTAEYYLSHCSKPIFPCTTYDEALIHTIVPELIKRLKEKQVCKDY